MTATRQSVMLVEDDPAILKLTTRILQNIGHEVFSAANGTDALSTYETHKESIGIVLTDVQMPDITGHELAIQLRSKSPNLPIVLVSGYAQDQLAEDTNLEGIFYLQKPFNKAALQDTINNVLGNEI